MEFGTFSAKYVSLKMTLILEAYVPIKSQYQLSMLFKPR